MTPETSDVSMERGNERSRSRGSNESCERHNKTLSPMRSISMELDLCGVADTFNDLFQALRVQVDHIFVPKSLMFAPAAGQTVHSNDDIVALDRAFSDGGVVWIHGSSSPALKTLLRERCTDKCYVSDIVRSDTGHLAELQNVGVAPLGCMSSEAFCRTVESLNIVTRPGGWAELFNGSRATCAYVFSCSKPKARLSHNFPVCRVDLTAPRDGEQLMQLGLPQDVHVLVRVESQGDSACVRKLMKQNGAGPGQNDNKTGRGQQKIKEVGAKSK